MYYNDSNEADCDVCFDMEGNFLPKRGTDETVALLAEELNISLGAIVFPDTVTTTVSKTVTDLFAGKSEAEIQKYISLCQQADAFKTDK